MHILFLSIFFMCELRTFYILNLFLMLVKISLENECAKIAHCDFYICNFKSCVIMIFRIGVKNMGLFFGEKFTDTIFVKEDSKLEKDITYLKSIRDKVVEKDKIDQDIKLMEIGLYGEKQISFELKNANLGMYVLHDVTLQYEDLTAQIDYVVITKGYTYFIECKNLIGNVKVDNKGEFVRTIQYGSRMIKEAIYSPYTQAERHKEVYMKGWYQRNKGLKTLIFEKGTRNNLRPLIVLANPKGILDIKYAPKEIRNCTIRVDQLVSYIKKDLEAYDKDIYSSQKEMLDIANRFLSYNVEIASDFENKYTFSDSNIGNSYVTSEPIVQNVTIDNNVSISNNNKEDLIGKLKEFRKQKSARMGKPAFYIFNDEELEKILNANIRTMEELRNSKILPEVKVRLHGQEIISIINGESK